MYAQLSLGTRKGVTGLWIRDDSDSILFYAEFYKETYVSLLKRLTAVLNEFGLNRQYPLDPCPVRLSRKGVGSVFAEFLEDNGFSVVDPE